MAVEVRIVKERGLYVADLLSGAEDITALTGAVKVPARLLLAPTKDAQKNPDMQACRDAALGLAGAEWAKLNWYFVDERDPSISQHEAPPPLAVEK
jgi:hypothetical protein